MNIVRQWLQITLESQDNAKAYLPYLKSGLVIFLATLAGALVNTVVQLNPANLVMFYLLAVVIVALNLGYGPSILTALVSVLILNFVFVPPRYTFRVADAQYLLTFLGLFGVGTVIASLTSRARNQTEEAQRREYETAQLYSLSKALSTTIEQQALASRIVIHAQQIFGCKVAILLPNGQTLQVVASSPEHRVTSDTITEANKIYKQVLKSQQQSTPSFKQSQSYFLLSAPNRPVGILVLSLMFDSIIESHNHLLSAFLTQSALALDAAHLEEEAREAQLLREKETLQTAVLNSISHDLRTPLVSITGTLSSLLDESTQLEESVKQELLTGAYTETTRLNQLVGNLLDMSRLEAGSLTLKRDLYDLDEIIGIARSRLREQLIAHRVSVDFPADLKMIEVDLTLFVQVIINLLDNARKYSPQGSLIEIHAEQSTVQTRLIIADSGIGIPPDELEQIFDKFYRATTATLQGGSGLGLSICYGIIEAHGGHLYAELREGGGSRFIIELPF